MDYKHGNQESDSSSDTSLVGSDSGFESDIRMRTKSLEVADTRGGRSQLVVSGFSPLLTPTRIFSHTETVPVLESPDRHLHSDHVGTQNQEKLVDRPTKVSFSKGR